MLPLDVPLGRFNLLNVHHDGVVLYVITIEVNKDFLRARLVIGGDLSHDISALIGNSKHCTAKRVTLVVHLLQGDSRLVWNVDCRRNWRRRWWRRRSWGLDHVHHNHHLVRSASTLRGRDLKVRVRCNPLAWLSGSVVHIASELRNSVLAGLVVVGLPHKLTDEPLKTLLSTTRSVTELVSNDGRSSSPLVVVHSAVAFIANALVVVGQNSIGQSVGIASREPARHALVPTTRLVVVREAPSQELARGRTAWVNTEAEASYARDFVLAEPGLGGRVMDLARGRAAAADALTGSGSGLRGRRTHHGEVGESQECQGKCSDGCNYATQALAHVLGEHVASFCLSFSRCRKTDFFTTPNDDKPSS